MHMDQYTDINLNEMIAWRRHFHMYPELSGSERDTATFLLEAGILLQILTSATIIRNLT